MRIKNIIFSKDFLLLLIVTVVVFLSYGQLLQMYFWHDDYTWLYYLQRGEFLWWPFHSLYILQGIFFKLFGLEPVGYFLVLVGMYISASWLLYYFLRLLFRNYLVAFFSVLVFSAGYTGQESMQSFFGLGFENLLGLNLFLFILICLYKSNHVDRLVWSVLAVVSFFVIMEFAIHRYAGIIVATVVSDFFLTLSGKKGEFSGFFKRLVAFTLVFYIQLAVKPSYYLLQGLGVLWTPHEAAYTQGVSGVMEVSKLIDLLRPENVINVIGTFWNLLMPSLYQSELYFFLIRGFPAPVNQYWFWLSSVPLLVFVFVMLAIASKLKRIRFLYVFFFTLFVFIWGRFVLSSGGYPIDQISKLNGGVFLAFLCIIYIRGAPAFRLLTVYSLMLVFSVVFPFYMFNREVLPSYHNYLFSTSAVLGSVLSFFVFDSLFNKSGSALKRWSFFLLLLPLFVLTVTHLSASVVSQRKLVGSGIKYARDFYKALVNVLPSINTKKIIYIEGETKQLGEVSGNLQRVGALGSEAAFAVHYNTKLENILLPTSTSEIKQKLGSQPDLSVDDVYSFVFDGMRMIDTSAGLRNLLRQEERETVMPPEEWEIAPHVKVSTEYFEFLAYTLGVYPQVVLVPKQRVLTQLPLKVRIKLRASLDNDLKIPYYHLFQRPEYPNRQIWQEILSWEVGQCEVGNLKGMFECVTDDIARKSVLQSKQGKINISWDYNTYGPTASNKFVNLEIALDGKFHEYEFEVSGGGEYLKNFTVNYISFPGTLEFGGVVLSYY